MRPIAHHAFAEFWLHFCRGKYTGKEGLTCSMFYPCLVRRDLLLYTIAVDETLQQQHPGYHGHFIF